MGDIAPANSKFRVLTPAVSEPPNVMVASTPAGSGSSVTVPDGTESAGKDVLPRRPSLTDTVTVGGVVAGLFASVTTSTRAVTLPDSGHSLVPTATPLTGKGWRGAVAPNTPALTRWTARSGS